MPSTVIRNIDYNETESTLLIEFVSGLIYLYKNVPAQTYNALKASKVKGIYFNNYIKDTYSFDRVDNSPSLFEGVN